MQAARGRGKGVHDVLTYLTLWKWTQQGATTARETVDRLSAFREVLEGQGGQLLDFGWTQGPYDGYALIQAPDEQTVMAVLLDLVGAGNVTTTTLRVFKEQEMRQVIQRLG